MVISEREYEKLKNSKEEKESVCNKEYEKVIAEQKRQIEELKKQSGIEAMMQPYLDCSNKYFYVKLPVSVIDKWNEYVKIQLYGRQHAFEIALIKYINKYYKDIKIILSFNYKKFKNKCFYKTPDAVNKNKQMSIFVKKFLLTLIR